MKNCTLLIVLTVILNCNSIQMLQASALKVSINCCCTKKMLRSDINLHTCARMEPLYPLLKVMPDASIVLQVKDSREKDRNTPSGRREGRAKWEHQDFSLFYIPPLSFFSFCFLLSPGRYKRRKIWATSNSPHTEIFQSHLQAAGHLYCFKCSTCPKWLLKQIHIHKHT